MKVFHIVCHTMEQYYPHLKNNAALFGNLDHSVNNFIKNLVKHDQENEHVLINLSSTLTHKQELIHRDGYKVIVLPGKYFFNDFFQYSGELLDFIRIEEGNFHIHGTSNFLFDAVSFALRGKKAIAHHRGGHFTYRAFPISFFKYFITFPLALRCYKNILVENSFRKTYFEKYYGISPEKITVIPGTVDTEIFQLKNYAQKEDKKLIYVGRLEKNKGICDLLDSFTQINSPVLKLDIVGEGSLLTSLRDKYKSNTSVTFYGLLSPQEVAANLQDADIFVHPSYSDSFGLSLLEAISCGLTIISTDVEGPKSILLEGDMEAQMYPPGDISKLTSLIKKSLEMTIDERKELGEKGRRVVFERFTFKTVAETLKSIYRTL